MSGRARGAAAPRQAQGADRDRLVTRVWLRLLAGTTLVTEQLRSNLRTEFGVTLPVFDLLAQAQREPTGPTMSELSRRLMVTKGNVSELVERLEREGLVERRPDERDGRVQHVHLTAAGGALVARMLPAHRSWLSALMAGIDDATLSRLAELLAGLKTSVSDAAGDAGGAPATAGSARPGRQEARPRAGTGRAPASRGSAGSRPPRGGDAGTEERGRTGRGE